MKLTNEQIQKIITAVCACITTIAAIILASACTISLSVSKNNSNSTQKTEQTSTSSVDSTYINLHR
jgi:outer membrane biogenesis lipoprotein LolB